VLVTQNVLLVCAFVVVLFLSVAAAAGAARARNAEASRRSSPRKKTRAPSFPKKKHLTRPQSLKKKANRH